MIAVAVAMDDFNCEACKWGKHCDESNPASFPMWQIPGVIESRTCFLPMVSAGSNLALRLYRHYQNQLLPAAGGILEQPAIYAEAMALVGRYVDQAVKRQNEHGRQRRKINTPRRR